MRADTQAVTVPGGYRSIFTFLADPANLPTWAFGFARGIRREGERWVVVTGHGEVPVRVEADEARGVIDFHLEPAPGVEAVAYSRLLPNGDGAEYVFTQFQTPGMPDDIFSGQRAALAEELAILPAIIRARTACDAGM